MQCMHMNEIYSIDKKLVKRHPENLPKGLIEKIRHYDESWDRAVDEYFKGKQWVFFNSKPLAFSNDSSFSLIPPSGPITIIILA